MKEGLMAMASSRGEMKTSAMMVMDALTPSAAVSIELPTPERLDDIQACIELAVSIMSADGATLCDNLRNLAAEDDLRAHGESLASASEWLSAWSALVSLSHERLSAALSTSRYS